MNEMIVQFIGEYTDEDGKIDFRECIVHPSAREKRYAERKGLPLPDDYKAFILNADTKYGEIKIATTEGEMGRVEQDCIEIIESK